MISFRDFVKHCTNKMSFLVMMELLCHHNDCQHFFLLTSHKEKKKSLADITSKISVYFVKVE